MYSLMSGGDCKWPFFDGKFVTSHLFKILGHGTVAPSFKLFCWNSALEIDLWILSKFWEEKLYAMDSSLPSLRYTSWAQSLINLSYWMHITDSCLSCVFHFCSKFLSHWEQLCCVLSCLLFVRLFSNWPYKLNVLSIPAWPFFTFPFFLTCPLMTFMWDFPVTA